MTSQRAETKIEQDHGHCADVLMDDYGIRKGLRIEVCEEIARAWQQETMFHDLIIASVRGWRPRPSTEPLEAFLQKHRTHSPKNRKPT